MSKILNQKLNKQYIGIFDNISSFSNIEHYPTQVSTIRIGNYKFEVSCLSCMFPNCMKYRDDEIEACSKIFKDFPIDANNFVCPTGALTWEKNETYPEINKDLCISCGLCASRCPIGAIYLDKAGAAISTVSKIVKIVQANVDNIKIHETLLNALQKVKHIGVMIEESETLFSEIYNKMSIIKTEAQFPNILTRNLLIQTGNRCFIRRRGDVYLRIDALMELSNEMAGIIEIEFNKDSLESPRAILDDIAVLISRYGIEPSSIIPFIVSFEFPNIRTEYWRVIKDINNILKIKINSLSIGALMLFVWNFQKVDFIKNSFYADVDNSSIREVAETIVTRKINTTSETCAVFETKK